MLTLPPHCPIAKHMVSCMSRWTSEVGTQKDYPGPVKSLK
jgi:hypothetical protein